MANKWLTAAAAAAALAVPATAGAKAPDRGHTEFTVTQADALALYAADPTSAWASCDGFDVLAAFTVTRDSQYRGAEELRHVLYTGTLFRADDPSVSISYSGRFLRRDAIAPDGTETLTISGRQTTATIGGRPVQLDAGRSVIVFDAAGDVVSDVHHGPSGDDAVVCSALAG